MPTQTFSSFEAFIAANLHSCNSRGMVFGRNRGDWVMTQLIVNSLSVQWGRPGDSVIVEGAVRTCGVTIFGPTRSSSCMTGNGCQLDDSSLMIVQTGDEYCIDNHVMEPWFSVSVPNGVLARISGDATTPVASMHGVVHLPLEGVQRFRSVIRQFEEVVHNAPADFKSTAAQKAAEQKLD